MNSRALDLSFYVTVGLIAGAIIALQIGIMRVFAVGTWSHFGSFVISIAMLGFGVMSAAMCVSTPAFRKYWRPLITVALIVFGPLMLLSNAVAQSLGFNPIELIANPEQKFKLFTLFLVYFIPFLPGALFLGLVFMRGQAVFGKVYFADLTGSGLCGLVFLGGLYFVPPDWILLIPFGLWAVAVVVWFGATRAWVPLTAAAVLGAVSLGVAASHTRIDVNQFKGVSYARKFPDSKRIYRDYSPFGLLEGYASSYLHFAPGLSDNAAVNLEAMPKNAYIALYIDSDGPIGAMKRIPRAQQAYFEFLPMFAPYVVKKKPDVFVVQLGGGISSNLALAAGPNSLTVAESNPALLKALTGDGAISRLTGNPLKDGRVRVVPYDGRLYLGGVRDRYDIIDLSLADSTGLSHAGGFAIVEKYNYTVETLQDYMRALKPDGVLAITLWNKEDLPKSVPKLFATVASAARGLDGDTARHKLFIFHTYLSTVTVLYKKNGFTAAETAALREWSEDMSWELLHPPGIEAEGKDLDARGAARIWRTYRASHFIVGKAGSGDKPGGNDTAAEGPAPTWQILYRLMLGHMLAGRFDEVQRNYVFDTRPLTDNRPYFAAYIKPLEIPHFLDQLEAVSDEWGYLLLWATLIIAAIFGFFLMMIPVAAGWRTIFSRQPGKIGIFVYFFCLGTGYITIEVGLIGKFLVALSNPTISATVLITSMLFFSGIGSLVSARYVADCRRVMPRIFMGIGVLVAGGAFLFDPVLGAIGQWPYPLRIATCILLIAPAAFLMGFPFPTGMTMLSRLGKERFFLWAWGINGTFSVVGAVAVPIVNVLFGQQALLLGAAAIYLVALPAFFSLLKPAPDSAAVA
ncbi:MAG: hypothetical protein OXC10_07425 [Rhodospirillaceae bacterium]|nr:hypothetical protein [Rhodospirillaceae bacterium]